MALKTFRPTSPGLRHLVQVDRGHLFKGAPVKMLVEGKNKTGGRNAHGRITTRHIGGGHKQAYRLVDFKRRKFDMDATVERLEYDPNRTAYIALIKYADGTLSYILAPQRLAVGDKVVSGAKVDVKPGNAMPLGAMPIGTIVHNVELKPGRGGQMARSAGSFVQLVGRDAGWAVLKMNSGETRKVRSDCMASIGAVSNPDHVNEVVGKAGRSRMPELVHRDEPLVLGTCCPLPPGCGRGLVEKKSRPPPGRKHSPLLFFHSLAEQSFNRQPLFAGRRF